MENPCYGFLLRFIAVYYGSWEKKHSKKGPETSNLGGNMGGKTDLLRMSRNITDVTEIAIMYFLRCITVRNIPPPPPCWNTYIYKNSIYLDFLGQFSRFEYCPIMWWQNISNKVIWFDALIIFHLWSLWNIAELLCNPAYLPRCTRPMSDGPFVKRQTVIACKPPP